MAERGPLAATAQVIQLRGNPGHRKPPPTVKRADRAPKPPSYLDREAKAEWKRVVPRLEERAVLSELDRATLTMYCEAWSERRKLKRQLEKEGYTIKGYRGSTVKNPAWSLYEAANKRCTELAKRLGLDPMSRARLPRGEQDDDDPDGLLD